MDGTDSHQRPQSAQYSREMASVQAEPVIEPPPRVRYVEPRRSDVTMRSSVGTRRLLRRHVTAQVVSGRPVRHVGASSCPSP